MLKRSSITKKTRVTNYVEKAKQRTSRLLQNTFRFRLHMHFSVCDLVWEILRLSFSINHVADVVSVYYILLCSYGWDREMQISACNLVSVWKTSISANFTDKCFSISPKWTANSSELSLWEQWKQTKKSKLKINEKISYWPTFSFCAWVDAFFKAVMCWTLVMFQKVYWKWIALSGTTVPSRYMNCTVKTGWYLTTFACLHDG